MHGKELYDGDARYIRPVPLIGHGRHSSTYQPYFTQPQTAMSSNAANTGLSLVSTSKPTFDPASCVVTFAVDTTDQCPVTYQPTEDLQSAPDCILTITQNPKEVSERGNSLTSFFKTLGDPSVSLPDILWKKLKEAAGTCDDCTVPEPKEAISFLQNPEEVSRFLSAFGDWQEVEEEETVGTRVWRIATAPSHLIAQATLWAFKVSGYCEHCDELAFEILADIYSSPENMIEVYKDSGRMIKEWLTGSTNEGGYLTEEIAGKRFDGSSTRGEGSQLWHPV